MINIPSLFSFLGRVLPYVPAENTRKIKENPHATLFWVSFLRVFSPSDTDDAFSLFRRPFFSHALAQRRLSIFDGGPSPMTGLGRAFSFAAHTASVVT